MRLPPSCYQYLHLIDETPKTYVQDKIGIQSSMMYLS